MFTLPYDARQTAHCKIRRNQILDFVEYGQVLLCSQSFHNNLQTREPKLTNYEIKTLVSLSSLYYDYNSLDFDNNKSLIYIRTYNFLVFLSLNFPLPVLYLDIAVRLTPNLFFLRLNFARKEKTLVKQSENYKNSTKWKRRNGDNFSSMTRHSPFRHFPEKNAIQATYRRFFVV